MRILISGCGGLIGGEAVDYFCSAGHEIVGIENNMRQAFFGPQGSVDPNIRRLRLKHRFHVQHMDIRDRHELKQLYTLRGPFDAVIHCAAQPSHDWAKKEPFTDFDINAVGTLNMLEMTRQLSPEVVFVFLSTNKVYGAAPNEVPFVEFDTRYDFADMPAPYGQWYSYNGINERCRLDRSCHSIFGVSKAAADLMTQEYANTYGMKTVVFRGGCLTGSSHAGVGLHGFLSYLVKCAVQNRPYTIYGYSGMQVRDNIDAYDVTRAIEEVILNPRVGEVYNIGGGRDNSCSVKEAIIKIQRKIGKDINFSYNDENRLGDHICYISDTSKFRAHYPNWKITKSLDNILDEMIEAELASIA